MSKLKAQIGTAKRACFDKKTWEFEMKKDFRVSGGDFAIIPLQKYEALISALESIRNSVNVHPDCEEDSEFADMVDICDEALAEVK
jgi:hypothetical protein